MNLPRLGWSNYSCKSLILKEFSPAWLSNLAITPNLPFVSNLQTSATRVELFLGSFFDRPILLKEARPTRQYPRPESLLNSAIGGHRVVIPELRQSQDARAEERLREVSRAI
jgi:hypothetical protein